MSKRALAVQSDGLQQLNSLTNRDLAPEHSPAPGSGSALNAQACQWPTSSNTDKAKHKPGDDGLQIPSDWPKHVVFITQNLVASSIPDSIAQRYVLPPSTSSSSSSPPSDIPVAGPSSNLPRATHHDGAPETLYTTSMQQQVPLVILSIDKTSPWCPNSFHSTSRNLTCHPAAGSFGLFAAQDIEPNTFIRPYLGVLHTKADADFYSTYDLSLCHDPRLSSSSPDRGTDVASHIETLSLDSESDSSALYLDSRWWGNESRFVNDYRGIAAKPNVEFRSFVQVESAEERFQMGLFATRPIKRGQELVINYGKSFWIHYDQLNELQSEAKADAAPLTVDESSQPPNKEVKLDPIQAMLQRSRMRISKQPPRQPAPHT